MRDVMRAQDCLFTLVVRHPDGPLSPASWALSSSTSSPG